MGQRSEEVGLASMATSMVTVGVNAEAVQDVHRASAQEEAPVDVLALLSSVCEGCHDGIVAGPSCDGLASYEECSIANENALVLLVVGGWRIRPA